MSLVDAQRIQEPPHHRSIPFPGILIPWLHIGAAETRQVRNDDPEGARQRFDVAVIVRPTRGAGPAAMQQNQGVAVAGFVVVDLIPVDVDELAGAFFG